MINDEQLLWRENGVKLVGDVKINPERHTVANIIFCSQIALKRAMLRLFDVLLSIQRRSSVLETILCRSGFLKNMCFKVFVLILVTVHRSVISLLTSLHRLEM